MGLEISGCCTLLVKMSVSGLAGSLSGYCIHLPARSSRALDGRIHAFPQIRISERFLQLGGYYLLSCYPPLYCILQCFCLIQLHFAEIA